MITQLLTSPPTTRLQSDAGQGPVALGIGPTAGSLVSLSAAEPGSLTGEGKPRSPEAKTWAGKENW